MKSLFPKDLIAEIESLLEWTRLGQGFDYSEYFENEEDEKTQGKFGFVQWPTGIDKEAYKAKIKWHG